jgi:peptidoglycan/LPS O-acetylase OafA/YrhL
MPNIAKQFYPEIQGIRAISIIAVILFHFGVRALPGGYIGVDMFFVISGFLITKMIVGEVNHGTFPLVRFYKNRVVRLLPNLFLMIAATVVISYFVLRPYDFFQYAKSLQFSAIYLTNMVFARHQGYFDMSRDVKPLLHTWSLSIEEQFYLIFPIFIILLFKLKSYRITVLVVIALASLGVRFNYIQHHLPTEGFFSFAGRVWEFIIGGLIVLMPNALKNKFSNSEIISSLGLLLIAASLLFLAEGLPYSGLLLVVPCLATAMVILASQNTRSSKWLGSKALVLIGGMSYSLYLWHWPLMVWFHNVDYGLSDTSQTFILLALTVTVSYLAWKYVEEPCRQNREKFSGKTVATMTFSFALFCASIGGYIYAQSGMENRFPSYVAVKKNIADFDFKAATGMSIKYPNSCSSQSEPEAILKQCIFGDLSSKNRFLILGDSHAAVWYPTFQVAAETKHWQGVLVSLAGCPPIFNISSFDGAKNICDESFNRRIGALLETGKFQKVFLVAHWSMYSEGEPSKQPNHFISDAQTTAYDAASSKQVMTRQLQKTIHRMNQNGSEVIIVHSVPTLPKVIQDLPENYTQPRVKAQQQNQFMTDWVYREQKIGQLSAVDPTTVLCDAQNCKTRINDNVLYTDNNHISAAAAAELVKLIEPVF